MIELKRCPFCGDEVEIAPTGLYHWKYAIHHKNKTECILDANAFALPYEEDDIVRLWNGRADRKTDNSSEKPNNCTDCECTDDCTECREAEHGCKDEPQTERSEYSIPSAQPKTGEVIPHRNYKYLSDYWCECGWHLGKKNDVNYCANCGKRVLWDEQSGKE